tara:strand:- start:1404 stop:1796 length:393 start_codon:yes stop_codon:yes gene_type:complete
MEILIDFDSTCVVHRYPESGPDIKGAVDVLKELVANGHKLILFTMRSRRDSSLSEAVSWFRERGIKLHGIQKNPTQESWTDSPKAYGQLIIDDTCLGIPLIYNPAISDRNFIDWKGVRILLLERGIITPK